MKRTTVFLVDDHAIMRMGLASLLATYPEIKVLGDGGDEPSTINRILSLSPDVVIIDLIMPRLDGAEATRRRCSANPNMRVLILTTFCTSDGIANALNAGALGAILKNADLSELLEAVRTVAAGKRFLSAEIEQIMTAEPPLPKLSARQREVLSALARGMSNTEIAKLLGISLPMVKEHVNALRAKLNVANRTEAVALALRKQLLKI